MMAPLGNGSQPGEHPVLRWHCPGIRVSDDLERCREVAGATALLAAKAIRLASATGAGQGVAVFIDQLRPGSQADVGRSFDLTHEPLEAIAAGVSVSALIPALEDVSRIDWMRLLGHEYGVPPR